MSSPLSIIDTFERRRPDAVELAVYASPAVRVEPELLRALRLGLLPRAGPQAEADLWFSPLVRARGVDGIALHDDVLQVLRSRLRERWNRETTRAQRAWAIIAAMHANISPALGLEERVAWLTICGAGSDRVERELYRALRAIEGGNRPNLVRWAANAWRRLPPDAQKTTAGWLLGQVSGAAKRGPVRVVTAPEGVEHVNLALLVGSEARSALGVRRDGAVLELGAVSGPGASAIEVLDTEPRLVGLLPERPRREPPKAIPVPSGTVVRLDVGEGKVRLITALQEVYELPSARMRPPPDIFSQLAAAPAPLSADLIDFRARVNDVARSFTGRASTIAALDAALTDTSFRSGYIVITGEPGAGKTALLGHLVLRRGYVHHFNAPVLGTASPQAFLSNVCAQLIVRYRLDYAALPAEATQDATFLTHLLAEATAKSAHEPVVVLVDAVDEAEPPARQGANPLFLPSTVPDGAYLVITMRPGALNSLKVEHQRVLRIDPDYADIYAYVKSRLEASPDAAARLGMDIDSLASLLADRSEGNFMYAVYVTEDLLAGRFDQRAIEDLSPGGLNEYYDRTLRVARRNDSERFDGIYAPVLRVLAAADEPVSIHTLQTETGLSQAVLQDVVSEWSRFLEVVESERYGKLYKLYHVSFREFLVANLGLAPPSVDPVEAELATARGIADDVERAKALAAVVPHAPEELRAAIVEETFTTTLAIADQRERAAIMTALAPHFSGDLLGGALAEARALTDSLLRAEVLIALVPYLGRESRNEAISEALDVVASTAGNGTRNRLLMSIVSRLSGDENDELLERAISMAAAVEDPRVRGDLFLAIARVLPEARRTSLLGDSHSSGTAETMATADETLDKPEPARSEAADPFETLWLSAGRIFIDRQALREGVRMLTDPSGPKILIVNGPPGSGKSFTFSYIKYIADRTGAFQVVYVNLADYPTYGRESGPEEIVRGIAEAMGISTPSLDPTTLIDHGIRQLVNWLVGRMRQLETDWWWILDGFPSRGLPPETSALINTLARAIERGSLQVRLVLLGFDEPLALEVDPYIIYREQLTHIGEREVRQHVADLLRQASGEVDPEQVEVVMRALRRRAPNATLAEFSAALRQLNESLLPQGTDYSGPDAQFLLTAAEQLTKVNSYLHDQEGLTSVENLDMLRRFLEQIGNHLKDINGRVSSLPRASKGAAEAIQHCTEALTIARQRTRTLKVLTDEWNARTRDRERPLSAITSDYGSLMEEQNKFEVSITNLAGHLRSLVQWVSPLEPSLAQPESASGPLMMATREWVS